MKLLQTKIGWVVSLVFLTQISFAQIKRADLLRKVFSGPCGAVLINGKNSSSPSGIDFNFNLVMRNEWVLSCLAPNNEPSIYTGIFDFDLKNGRDLTIKLHEGNLYQVRSDKVQPKFTSFLNRLTSGKQSVVLKASIDSIILDNKPIVFLSPGTTIADVNQSIAPYSISDTPSGSGEPVYVGSIEVTGQNTFFSGMKFLIMKYMYGLPVDQKPF